VFPGSSSDFGGLLADSSLVVRGTIDAAPDVRQTQAGASSTEFRLQNVSQFAGQGSVPPSSTLLIDESGGVPVPLLPPSDYVLFLADVGGTGHYTVADGMAGVFTVNSGKVDGSCPNYSDPQARREAVGSGVALQAFEELVRRGTRQAPGAKPSQAP
jgi:hypothetical protein